MMYIYIYIFIVNHTYIISYIYVCVSTRIYYTSQSVG